MAVYDPPQPLWKRNVAGILDFFLSAIVFGFIFNHIFGSQPGPQPVLPSGAVQGVHFNLSGWSLLFTVAAVVAYFILAGRTGGTVFQRLFQMKRAG